ncbi:response regulator [Aestuariivita boseongensis]|uniref:response regulator n=1 Tax=Aestuariivita boseongensis TaxID=1470562 RepID=UPI0006801F71|nr:response regulator [Aestuariivita boseongensis]
MSQPIKIVHVDDDEDILTLTKMSLEYFGNMAVSQFTSGQQALDNIDRVEPDLLLLDVMMPDIDGFTLLKKIRELPKFAGIEAIFMTAKAEMVSAERAREPGVLGMIVKPFDTPTLPQVILDLWKKSER